MPAVWPFAQRDTTQTTPGAWADFRESMAAKSGLTLPIKCAKLFRMELFEVILLSFSRALDHGDLVSPQHLCYSAVR
jgi:hypothetical protein